MVNLFSLNKITERSSEHSRNKITDFPDEQDDSDARSELSREALQRMDLKIEMIERKC